MHIMETHYLVLTNYRNVILHVASHNAGMTSGTRVHVDAHSPLDTRLIVIRIDRTLFFKIFYSAPWLQLCISFFEDFVWLVLEGRTAQFFDHLRTLTLRGIV